MSSFGRQRTSKSGAGFSSFTSFSFPCLIKLQISLMNEKKIESLVKSYDCHAFWTVDPIWRQFKKGVFSARKFEKVAYRNSSSKFLIAILERGIWNVLRRIEQLDCIISKHGGNRIGLDWKQMITVYHRVWQDLDSKFDNSLKSELAFVSPVFR